MNKCESSADCKFPPDDWDEEFRERSRLPVPDPITYLDQPLSLIPPEELAAGVDECAILMMLKQYRPQSEAQIYREAQGADQAAATVLAAVGLSTDHPVNLKLKDARRYIVSQIADPIDEFKRKFLRGRPWTCCGDELEPMFLRPHWRYPGTPAYPSGHATVAWTFAYLFGALSPKGRFKSHLEHAAARVARNREIAGVHYPSDSEAGRQLARQLVDIMLKTNEPDFALHCLVIKTLLFSPGYETSKPA